MSFSDVFCFTCMRQVSQLGGEGGLVELDGTNFSGVPCLAFQQFNDPEDVHF